MRKNGKRILSFILTAVMVFALLPIIGSPMVAEAVGTSKEESHTHGKGADGNCSEHMGWTPISTETELLNLCKNGGKGYLTEDILIFKVCSILSGTEVSLCLNGYGITGESSKYVFDVAGGTLNLYDEEGNTGKITRTYNGSYLEPLIYVGNNGTVTMTGGNISGNGSSGVIINPNGLFTMTGGNISGNGSSGVDIKSDGTFTMTGGRISDNKSTGVVITGEGLFTMIGGEISDNIAKSCSGVDVYIGTFTMKGGKIINNTATDSYADAVRVREGTLIMTGGEISGNTSYGKPSGINLQTTGCNVIISDECVIDHFNYNPSGIAKITFNSNFNTNGISEKTVYQYISKNEEAKLAKNIFTAKGKRFVFWLDRADGNGPSYNDEYVIKTERDRTFYAWWKDVDFISYDVTFKVKNGSWDDGTTGDKTVNLWRNADEDLALRLSKKDIPTVGSKPDPGFMAGSWDEEPTPERNVNDDKTYTYTYAPDPNAVKYTIAYDANGGNVNETSAETGYDLKLASLPTPELREGYDFEGWFTEKTGGTEITTDTVFDSNTTIYAQWKAHSYTVKFDENGGTGTMADMSRKYDDNTALTTNAFTFDGHTFSGWNTQTDGEGTSYADGSTDSLTSTDNDTVTLYAQWDSVFYNVAVANDGNGTATASAASAIKGTNITLTATPNEGYKFAGWEIVSGEAKITDTSAATTTLSVGTSDVEVKATFEEISEEPETPAPTQPSTPEPDPNPEIPAKDWLDDLRLALRIADELDGPQTVEYSGDFALSYDIMEYLKEHTDITLVYHVTYEGVEYTVTIPAGRAIADENIGWYGPLWLLANYGGDNVPEIIAGSGKYTVVAGDTLSAIAEKFGTTVDYLAKKNGIKNPDYIIVGQVIVY